MKKILFVFLLMVTVFQSYSQDSLFMFAEKMPEFPGGNAKIMNFIGNNVEYPDSAIAMKLQGRVIVKFIIDTNGVAMNPEIIRGVHPLLDSASLQVIRKLPPFTPGEQGGEKVKVYYVIPIAFQLSR